MQDLAQQPGQQRDKGHADQGNAAARDQQVVAQDESFDLYEIDLSDENAAE